MHMQCDIRSAQGFMILRHMFTCSAHDALRIQARGFVGARPVSQGGVATNKPTPSGHFREVFALAFGTFEIRNANVTNQCSSMDFNTFVYGMHQTNDFVSLVQTQGRSTGQI